MSTAKVQSAAATAIDGQARLASPPLIAHVVFRLDVGGLENGLVNLINRMPEDRFRHAIICLTDYSEFRRRIQRPDVPVFALHQPPGKSLSTYVKLWRLLIELRPTIIHTRNLAALESSLPAFLAGVPARIHSEHGRDMADLDGTVGKYRVLRRLFRPFVHEYVALSRDLHQYLSEHIRVDSGRVTQLYNGVDTDLFRPAHPVREPLPIRDFAGPECFVIGTVGRMQHVKDQTTLARAFVELVRSAPDGASRLRLVMVGDGPVRDEVGRILDAAGMSRLAWLPGRRDDVPRIMRGLDLFVLPSLAEGISNTILEAMASGLPIVATAVGGNGELIDEGRTGKLVPRAEPAAMAQAMLRYYQNPTECTGHGAEARKIAVDKFSIGTMVSGYTALYERVMKARNLNVRNRRNIR